MTEQTTLNTKQYNNHDQLLKALYWVWDAFERSQIQVFVRGKTAHSVITGDPLDGEKIEVGVREMEWVSGNRKLIDSFAPPLKDEGDKVMYEYEGVPVELKVYKDHPTITSCDTKIYHAEYFKIPNPLKDFKEAFNE